VSEAAASTIVSIMTVYLACGVVFAGPFVWRGVVRIDPVARDSTVGFRLLIVPGVTLLWPLLAIRWARGSGHPPLELTAHRRAAARGAR